MKKIIHTGLSKPLEMKPEIYHYPLIEIIPKSLSDPDCLRAFKLFDHFTHLIITSKSAASLLAKALNYFSKTNDKAVIAVGKQTAKHCEALGFTVLTSAAEETSEGVIEAIQNLRLDNPYFFWPHSALSRDVIPEFLKRAGYRFFDLPLYDTHPSFPGPLPELSPGDEIVFTSPSCVEAFHQFYGTPPPQVILRAIGPVTAEKINSFWISNRS